MTLLIEFMAKKSDVQDGRLMMGGGSCTATGTHRSPHRGPVGEKPRICLTSHKAAQEGALGLR